eukprot:CAMPEP_0197393832 /NCGR_PEP_ID=MMETSP1165-20131217/4542_1 /TAXON_ID=284809 /ORGANISM="Chrysocystis fragilis, Strain CCMP3189" /LENGTH=106 /DNA_ID=CAMNT_0042919509 /DNA_START=176 /DNA_END=493 /DNA_ORIENTATION=-
MRLEELKNAVVGRVSTSDLLAPSDVLPFWRLRRRTGAVIAAVSSRRRAVARSRPAAVLRAATFCLEPVASRADVITPSSTLAPIIVAPSIPAATTIVTLIVTTRVT